MLTIVCVYNNYDLLNEWLLKGLKNQTIRYELILIDNTAGNYSSAAAAFNKNLSKVNGDYIMFVHQDVEISCETWLEDTEAILDGLDSIGVAGVAGKKAGHEKTITSIDNGIPKRPAGTRVKQPTLVQTVDECLFIIPRKVYGNYKFDEQTCENWHLYCVDYCLSVLDQGLNVYVLPSYIYHRSCANSMNESYYSTLRKVLKKHRSHHGKVYSTVGIWDTTIPIVIQRPINFFLSIIKYLNRNISNTIKSPRVNR